MSHRQDRTFCRLGWEDLAGSYGSQSTEETRLPLSRAELESPQIPIHSFHKGQLLRQALGFIREQIRQSPVSMDLTP